MGMKGRLVALMLVLLAALPLLSAQSPSLEARVKALEEKVALLQDLPLAVYSTSGGVIVSNGGPEMDYLPLDKKLLDQRGIVKVGPPWRFVAPIEGTYRFDF